MTKSEFHRRRKELSKMIGKGGIAILPAALEKQRNNDVHYNYRPDSDFYYLTGFMEPESVAVIVPGRPQAEYILFVRDRDPARETWDGRRAGPEGATRDYGADDAFPIGESTHLAGLMRTAHAFIKVSESRFRSERLGWVKA